MTQDSNDKRAHKGGRKRTGTVVKLPGGRYQVILTLDAPDSKGLTIESRWIELKLLHLLVQRPPEYAPSYAFITAIVGTARRQEVAGTLAVTGDNRGQDHDASLVPVCAN
jgi:hypothetical protein